MFFLDEKNEILLLLLIFVQNIYKMNLGSKVIKYRRHKDMTQSMLAHEDGVSQSVISSLESDKSIPSAVMLFDIAKALEVDINELLSEESIVQNNSERAIGNIHSQVTINNSFPDRILELLLSNQEKITGLIENQNELIASLLKK